MNTHVDKINIGTNKRTKMYETVKADKRTFGMAKLSLK